MATELTPRYGWRIYAGRCFCRLDIGLATQESARAVVADEFARMPHYYTHAEITMNGAIIATVINEERQDYP